MASYEIRPALTRTTKGHTLTRAQRSSSRFQEAPRVAGKILRRGQFLVLNEEQFKADNLNIKRLYESDSIDIFVVEGDKRTPLDQLITTFDEVLAHGQLPDPRSSVSAGSDATSGQGSDPTNERVDANPDGNTGEQSPNQEAGPSGLQNTPTSPVAEKPAAAGEIEKNVFQENRVPLTPAPTIDGMPAQPRPDADARATADELTRAGKTSGGASSPAEVPGRIPLPENAPASAKESDVAFKPDNTPENQPESSPTGEPVPELPADAPANVQLTATTSAPNAPAPTIMPGTQATAQTTAGVSTPDRESRKRERESRRKGGK